MRYLFIINLVFILVSCGVHLDSVLKSPNKQVEELSNTLSFTVPSTKGTILDISDYLDKPTLIMFAQDTCETCGHETEMIVAKLNELGGSRNVNIITILVGTTLDDALWWEELFEVSWPVGFDHKAELFQNYCPERTVPCSIIVLPMKGIVYRGHGEISFEKISYYTGPWN
jgi:cytochrome oxidase Cu insertion factor (SCO1/SenC/PrrC family)